MAKTKHKAKISPLMADLDAQSKLTTKTLKVRTPRIRKKPAKLQTTPEALATARRPTPVPSPSRSNSVPEVDEWIRETERSRETLEALRESRKTKRISDVVSPVIDKRMKGDRRKKADEGKKGNEVKKADGGKKGNEQRQKLPPRKEQPARTQSPPRNGKKVNPNSGVIPPQNSVFSKSSNTVEPASRNIDQPPLSVVNEERPLQLRRSPRKPNKPRTTAANANVQSQANSQPANSQPVSNASQPQLSNASRPQLSNASQP